MPKVGKMKFPYTEQGMKDASNYAKQTGKSMEMEDGGMMPKYGHGGMVKPKMPMKPMYKHGGKIMPKYAGGGMVMSPAQKMAMADKIVKMMYGGKVKKKGK
tara:strand:- start:1932 stop:2234 length:303 start_codon:yes stop_codon:yes gene_type:complete